MDFGIFKPIQNAAAYALDHAEPITDNLRNVFSERHRILMGGLEELGWEVAPSQGGMFVWAKYPYDKDCTAFAFEVIEKLGVVTVPGTVFGTAGEGFLRLALVQPKERLQQAVARLATL